MVRVKGVEPPRLAAPDPKSGASANSATPAYKTAWQRPTLTGGQPPTTIGAEKLNFRVRYGNGCDLLAIIARLIYLRDRSLKTR